MAADDRQVAAPATLDTAREPEAIYIYTDERTQPLFEVCRFPGKRFAQRRSDGKGGWIWNLDGVRRVLYRLEEVMLADQIVVVEGERDTESLRTLGVIATTNSGGARGWQREYAEFLRGKRVAIIPDADEPGRNWADAIVRDLVGVAVSIQRLELPGIEPGSGGDISDWLAMGHSKAELLVLIEAAPEIKPLAEDGPALIRNVQTFIERFLRLPEHAALPISLWAIATHCFQKFDTFVYLLLTSPAPRCGKTRGLEVLELIVREPLRTSNISEAALFRVVEDKQPTLMIDEAESLGGKSERAEALRGLLNAGHRRGAVALRCAPDRVTVLPFATFCPKMVAGLGEFPATLRDRSLHIEMQRRSPSEKVARFNFSRVKPDGDMLTARISRWVTQNSGRIAEVYASAELPFVEDREEENWGPLFAVLAVSDPSRMAELRGHALALGAAKAEAEPEQSLSVRLLSDIRDVLRPDEEAIPTAELLARLRQAEGTPWYVESERARPEQWLSARRIARLLRPFGVRPGTVRLESKTAKGYYVKDLEPANARYLRLLSVTSDTMKKTQVLIVENDPSQTSAVTDEKTPLTHSKQSVVSDVTDKRREPCASESSAAHAVDAMAERLRREGRLF